MLYENFSTYRKSQKEWQFEYIGTKGAVEAGHSVIRVDTAFKKVHPCIACNHCQMDGDCVFNDDFTSIKENLISCDMVVFATPMYYFGISAQLKIVIDRFYSANKKLHAPKKSALFLTLGTSNAHEPVVENYREILKYLGWTNLGEIIAAGFNPLGSIAQSNFPNKAYEFGKSL